MVRNKTRQVSLPYITLSLTPRSSYLDSLKSHTFSNNPRDRYACLKSPGPRMKISTDSRGATHTRSVGVAVQAVASIALLSPQTDPAHSFTSTRKPPQQISPIGSRSDKEASSRVFDQSHGILKEKGAGFRVGSHAGGCDA